MIETSVRRGLTVPEVAQLYRVSEDKVRGWIRRGELVAINTRDQRCLKPRFVIRPEALAEFERRRQAVTDAPKPKRQAKRTSPDYFPDY